MKVRITIATPNGLGTILDSIVCDCDQFVRVISTSGRRADGNHYRDVAELNIGDENHYLRILDAEGG